MSTDYDWEKWGCYDPYFGVVTEDKYRMNALTDEVKKEFFDTGEKHIEHVISICRQQFQVDFCPKHALDFGCGVGRILIPLSSFSQRTFGIDVSESMLKEAHKNCLERKIENVTLLQSSSDFLEFEQKFDFIHTFIVLQHIATPRGMNIIQSMLDNLAEEGIAVIHLIYSKEKYAENSGVPKTNLLREEMKNKYRFFKSFLSRIRPGIDASMQMNTYDLNKIFYIFQSANFSRIFCEYTNHSGELGLVFYLKK